MIKIQESEMSFGEFQEENLFHIEKSKIYKEKLSQCSKAVWK